MLYYVYFSSGGIPVPMLNPTWSCLYEAKADGKDLTHQASEEVLINPIGDTIENPSAGCGWYVYEIVFGEGVWSNTIADLVGVIDGGGSLASADRYKEVEITLRNLGLARIAHKGIQTKSTGDVDIYATDGTTKEMKLDFTDSGGTLTRNPTAP
jgi:hypothetical protein